MAMFGGGSPRPMIAALSRIYPGAQIRCVLLWTDGPRLMPIPAELLDRRLP